MFESVEKFSVVKTLQAIERANVVVLVVDASRTSRSRTPTSAATSSRRARALVVAVNKWDAIDAEKRKEVKTDLESKLQFLDFADFVPISARMGTGIKPLLKEVDTAFAAAMAKIPTPKLTRALQAAVEQQQPPMAGRFRPKMRYAHQGGSNPPIIVIHGSGLAGVNGPTCATSSTLPQGLQAQGHAAAHRAALLHQPLRGPQKPLTEKQDAQRRRRKIVSKRRYG